LKLRIDLDGESYTLDLERNGNACEYRLEQMAGASGRASVVEVMPGVFSVLLGAKSITVHIVSKGDELEVWANGRRHAISIADARDRSAKDKKISTAGPMEIRAQIPGKVVKLLAHEGETVQAGQGVLVVEAMKMQNEMKSPKDGRISKLLVSEGATVAAGETLVIIE